MKKFILFIILTFLFMLRANASSQTLNPDMYVDSLAVYYGVGDGSPIYPFRPDSNITYYTDQALKIQIQGALNFSNSQAVQPNYIHERVYLCTEKGTTSGYSLDGVNVRNVNFVNTNLLCSFYSGGQGHVTVGTFYVVPFSYDGATYINRIVGVTVYSQSKVQYLGVEFGLQPFPEVFPETTLIQQNQEILQALQQGGGSQTAVVNAINTTNQKLTEQNQKLDSVNSSIQETNDSINDDDTSEATNSAGDFFSGFTTNTHGLTGIITAPLTLIGNITSSSCSPLSVPLPFVGENLSLPCMSSIYSRYFGNFYDMYKIITFGIVAYWVCVRVFSLVKDFKNPEHDEIEVMDL